jgi:hypothetical protein
VRKLIELTGQRVGRLVVTGYAGNKMWSCVCDCGARAVVYGGDLRRGGTRGRKSCGCLKRDAKIDLVARRFKRLTVLAYVGHQKWSCVCDCGAHVVVHGNALRRGRTKSCGCLCKELVKARTTTHGMSKSREYQSWHSMKQRCLNPRHPSYENYGGRGIGVCEEWLPFLPFFADTGVRPPNTSLDRKDVNGDYRPGNVRWVDAKQQNQNQRPRRRATVKRRQAKPLPPPDPPF